MARRKSHKDHFAELSVDSLHCPLCSSSKPQPYWQDRKRPYLQCGECHLVFVPSSYHLSPEQEKSEYDLHQNVSDDQGYRNFLSRALTPVVNRVTAPASGLDFGCGPGPVLAGMLSDAGYAMSVYDPYYAANLDVLAQSYDFITCTEVIEHVAAPDQVFSKLVELVNPGGIIVMMTKRVINRDAFGQWHYKNDPTHICFYSESTFEWLAQHHQLDCEFESQDVVVFRKDGE
ncbi:class I SAM-dependent methyltransferase [Litoribrevibacter albus]|uniref:2-polyprenyl-3-methyl-5-hydroxy-6-metoxy-1, 4-benzoquinol methylase n=1 Tax=Litoribrevibacter albus TaxID=1473156 RepID=A0AA37W786_9GAMM|nr:class I SAM-dependent methyltransferase [Litoribrevibacter albus]GLQ31004.1 2-polyprenyl-3-methyl-5-hydroxy-6-metoxy-1,4-benzoquinol methylase [Litoribrevibacter albus]